MRKARLSLLALSATVAVLGFTARPAAATWWHHDPACTPDSVGSGSVEIVDDFSGSFWNFSVEYEVFDDDNCANPNPVTGSFTYVYTVTLVDEGPVPISLEELRVLIDEVGFVLDAGFITGGPGVAPSSVDVVDAGIDSVTAAFAPGDFTLGDTSLPIYVVSPYQPGNGTINLDVSAFQGSGPALVPAMLPESCPCTPFFWKLRALGWLWFDHFFPGQQFTDIKARAVELSQGYFTDEADLVGALFYWGFLNVERKAERELAAVLLNVAAGELFPGNTKCRLFSGTEIDLDGDEVGDLTVDGAIGQMITNIESGDWHLQYEAFALGNDINDGRNVLGAVRFH